MGGWEVGTEGSGAGRDTQLWPKDMLTETWAGEQQSKCPTGKQSRGREEGAVRSCRVCSPGPWFSHL